jgi:phosphonate transport system ATP-binding protein
VEVLAVIRITGLYKEYPNGVQALCDVNLEIGKGEFVVLLGPSGAGKSTLLRCINGLVRPTAGQVEVNGVQVGAENGSNLRKLRRQIGMIFQQFNLVKRLRVLDNVLCGRLAYTPLWSSCFRFFSRRDVELAKSCLERVGLIDKAYQRADQLSGGQQQRVGIARALVQQPAVLLADEPVASLDPRSSRTVMETLREINCQDHITVIVSLHDVDLAMEFARRVVGIRDGNVIMDKPVSQVTRKDLEYVYDGMASEPSVNSGTYGRTEYAHA